MDDIAQLILPHAGDDDWTRWDGRWAPWRPGHALPPAPPSANVTEFGAYGRDVEVQVGCSIVSCGFVMLAGSDGRAVICWSNHFQLTRHALYQVMLASPYMPRRLTE